MEHTMYPWDSAESIYNVQQRGEWACVPGYIFTATSQKCMDQLGRNTQHIGNPLFIDALTYTWTGSQTHKGSHMHKVLPETTQPPYQDPFHLLLLTAVISCGLIGPHQTTSHIVCIPSLLTRTLPYSLKYPFPPSLAPSIPPPMQHQHPFRVCLSLAFISPAY